MVMSTGAEISFFWNRQIYEPGEPTTRGVGDPHAASLARQVALAPSNAAADRRQPLHDLIDEHG
jgi:hypothetical protein